MLNTQNIRQDFPLLSKLNPLSYLDNACMTLKPLPVIEALTKYYSDYPACAGRSNHKLSMIVEQKVEAARKTVVKFLNAKSDKEIVFTRNTTEGINLVANSLDLKPGDKILTSDKEHNSNLVPWLKLTKSHGTVHQVVPSKPDNTFDLEAFEKLLTPEVKLVSLVHTSNLDGVSFPIRDITRLAHANGSLVMIDAAQAAPHTQLDVQDLNVDLLSLSVHKLCGPTGMGILYGKQKVLDELDQFLVGGDTVGETFYDKYSSLESPEKFEAGLQDYAGIIATQAAIEYISQLGLDQIHSHMVELNQIVTDGLSDQERIEVVGPIDPTQRSGIFSCVIKDIDSHLVSKMLSDTYNTMTRSGRHCVHSWFNDRGIHSSLRASFYLYNTTEEAEKFVQDLKQIISII